MRRYKKAAVCLLAAAMALSMMTGCSGGNTPEKPADSKPGGGTSTVEPAPGPEDIVLPGDGGEETNKIPVATEKSKLAQFNAKVESASEYYVEKAEATYLKKETGMETTTASSGTTFACKGDSLYVKTIGQGKNGKVATELLRTKNRAGNYGMYLLLPEGKVALKAQDDDGGDAGAKYDILFDLPTTGIYSTQVTVNGKVYDAETYIQYGTEHTVCFAQDGMPKYEFVKYGSHLQSIAYNVRLGPGSSQGLCTLPADYKKYTINVGESGNLRLRDADNNVYEIKTNDNKKIVVDQNETDVTDQFPWLPEFLEVMD